MNSNTEFLNFSVEFIPNSSVNEKGKKMLTTLISHSHSLSPMACLFSLASPDISLIHMCIIFPLLVCLFTAFSPGPPTAPRTQ